MLLTKTVKILTQSLCQPREYPVPSTEDFQPYESSHPTENVPVLSVRVSDNLISVDFPHASRFTDVVSPQEEMEVEYKDVRKFMHDFTFRFICKENEEPIQSIIPGYVGNHGLKTPDWVFSEGGVWHIVEFGTRRLPHYVSLEEYAKVKVEKYTPLIEDLKKAGIPCKYDVLIVSGKRVLSTFAIDNDLVRILTSRYVMAFTAFSNLLNDHPELRDFLKDDDEVVRNLSQMMNCFQEISSLEPAIKSLFNEYLVHPEPVSFRPSKIVRRIDDSIRQRILHKASPIKLEDFIAPGGRDDNTDSISRLPLIIPYPRSNLQPFDIPHNAPEELEYVWNNGIGELRACPKKYDVDNFPKDEQAIFQHIRDLATEEGQVLKKERFRFTIPKHHRLDRRLALLGVHGKQYKDDPHVQSRRKYTQLHISSNTYTGDIQEFIDGFPDLTTQSPIRQQHTVLSLLEEACGPHIDKISPTFVKLHDPVYESLIWMAAVATEVSASIKQGCKPNKFLLKRMKDYDCTLLLKTTNSQSHVFVSICVRVERDMGVGHVFPERFDAEDGWSFYHFKSFQVPCLESLIKLPEMYLSMKYQCSKSRALMSELAMGLLIGLDNKADAEEAVTKTRYIYMKGLELPVFTRDPWVVMDGMTKRPRSRLTLFLIKRALTLCERVPLMQSSLDEDARKAIVNIPAFSTDDYLDSWEDVLTTVYMGYFRNKNSYTSGNQSMALLEKIVEPEMKFREDRVYREHVLNGDSDNPSGMEWDIGYLLWCCELLLDELKKRGQKNPKDVITKKFYSRLAQYTLDDLATLKATNVDMRTGKYHLGEEHIPRRKVLTVLMEDCDQYGVNLADALPRALQVVAARGGTMIINLFKKPQHGGLREIYVMDLASRIVQFSLEQLGIVICGEMDHETMTHNRMKYDYRAYHHAKVNDHPLAHRASLEILTLSDAKDAAKWNQMHHVVKFLVMFTALTSPELHSFVRIGLSMWLNKKIQMDTPLMKSMMTGKYKPSSPVAAQIVKWFQGAEASPILEPHGRVLNIQTGMMQGLLHFTSSALHAVNYYGVSKLCKIYMEIQVRRLTRRENKQVVLSSVNTIIVSSDDSAAMHTVFSNLGWEKALYYGLIPCSVITQLCDSMMGITVSNKKSAMCIGPISEFNSMWMGDGGAIRPSTRHILACQSISSIGSLLEQQDQLSTLRQECLEAGMSLHHVNFINYLQGVVYYRCMGSSTLSLFNLYAQKLRTLPDPNLGFFLMDPPKLSGIISTDYNVYQMCQHSLLLSAKYNKYSHDTDALIGTRGSLRSNLQAQITFTNEKKYRALLSSIDKEGIAKIIAEDPGILYRKPTTKEEVKLSLTLKIMSIDVMRSLSKDYNAQARAMAASVYMLWAQIIKKNISFLHYIKTGLPQSIEKTNIITQLTQEIAVLKEEPLNDHTKAWFFPLHDQFDKLTSICREADARILAEQRSEPKQPVIIEIMPGYKLDLPLPTVAKYQWFEYERFEVSPGVMGAYWLDYKGRFPFLRDTHNETMVAAGLRDPRVLKSALEKTSKKGRFLHVTSRGGRNMNTAGLLAFISYNYRENHVLKMTEYLERQDDPMRKALRRMSMALETPFSDEAKLGVIKSEVNRLPLSSWVNHPRYSIFSLIHKNCPSQIPSGELVSRLRLTTCLIGSFTHRQKRVKRGVWKGLGWWNGVAIDRNNYCNMAIKLQDDKIVKIIVSNLDVAKAVLPNLLKMFAEWKSKTINVIGDGEKWFLHDNFNQLSGTPVVVDTRHLSQNVLMQKFSARLCGKRVQIWSEESLLYEFKPLPQMVAKGSSSSKSILDMILDNTPIPYTQVKKFILSPPTDRPATEELKQWLIQLAKTHRKRHNVPEKPAIMQMTSTELENIEFDIDLIESCIYEAATSLGLEAGTEATVVRDLAEAYMGMDADEEKARLFMFSSEGQNLITSAHYYFLDDFLSEYSVVMAKFRRTGVAEDEDTKKLMNVISSIDPPSSELQMDVDTLLSELISDTSAITIYSPDEMGPIE